MLATCLINCKNIMFAWCINQNVYYSWFIIHAIVCYIVSVPDPTRTRGSTSACELGLVPRLCAIVHWISEVRLYTYGLSEVQLGLESKLNLKLNLTQSISTTLIQCLMKLHKLQITSIEDIHPIKTHIHYFAPPLFSSWRHGHWTAACASRQSVVTTVSSVLWHWVGRRF